ncbi:MAG: type VI secretion system tip protein VgrG [Deltaproteobacteria bacterium]|nr:type VI secretion system tip protein VgrG [Deltaproteobacteria bacterium]
MVRPSRPGRCAVTRFEVKAFLAEGVSVDPDAVIKSSAALVLRRADQRRRIDLVVSEVFLSHTVSGRPELEVILEPRFALSRYRTNLKVYRNKSAIDVVCEVLGELGVTFDMRASACPVRPYTVQFRESDFHFVSRMLEEEGLFYTFAEGDVMVIGDNVGAYGSVGTVPCLAPAGTDEQEESVWAMGGTAEASVGKVSLRDWWIETPSLAMDVEAPGPLANGPEFYDFPGEYSTPAEGQRIATLMTEAYGCVASGVAGTSSVGAFGPGQTFTVDQAPDDSLLGSFVITAVDHDYDLTREGFAVSFEGLPAGTVFRPARRHEEPILPNPITGIVTGPPGADIHCDELGRVKVHFHWDRLLPYDDDCSHWIPVLQDNTGHSVGIPRVGWEVLVHFLEGDPDRPLVLGRVYNAEDLIPIQLPENKTITALKSLCSPQRDGTNEIEVEDRAGQERIAVFAEKDQNVVVANDRTERVLFNAGSTVGNDETIQIGNNDTVKLGAEHRPDIGANQSVSIGGNEEQSLGGSVQETVQGNGAYSIGGNHLRRVATDDATTGTVFNEQVGAAVLEASLGSNSLAASTGMVITVGGAVIEGAMADKSEASTYARAETIGGVCFTKAKEEIKVNAGKSRITTVGGALKVDAKGLIAVAGLEKLTTKSLTQEHLATTELTLKVGDTSITMKEGLIQLDAPDTIAFDVESDNILGSSESHQN